MKRTCVCLLILAGWTHADEVKTFSFNADAWTEGDVPKEVFLVDGTIKIAAKDGNKAIMIDPTPITDATAQLGDSSNGSSSIEARVFASKKGRAQPRFGISVHGMNGYRLFVNASKKQLELIKGDAVIKSAPFAWTTDTWTKLRLEAKKTNDTEWTITGKAWPADGEEPKDAAIQHTDTALKGQGKCAIWGTPFSETPIYFDDIKIGITSAAAK
jgi:hypothetical protein